MAYELRKTGAGISPHRIGAMILRYWYVLMSSWPRLMDLLYWPALQIVTWGFLQSYISQNAGFFARAGGTLVGAVILWDILFRGQLGFAVSFLEEMWARNLGNLMMSPLKPIELLIALMAMSLIRLAIGIIPMTLLAMIFFDFNLYGIGFPLIAFFCNLIFTSWSLGIVVSGLVVLVVCGIFKTVLAQLGNAVRRLVPRAGLLGSLSAIAIVLIAFLPLVEGIAPVPPIGMLALVIILFTLVAHRELPGKIVGRGGELSLRRFQKQPGGVREGIPAEVTREVFLRLVDDFSEAAR